jgi:serine/threonine protein phosphatase PrpC
MHSKNKSLTAKPATKKCFRIGPPQDSDNLLRLFSLVLEKADNKMRDGSRFEIPFAALLRLGHSGRPTLEDLVRFAQSGNSRTDWPAALVRSSTSTGGNHDEHETGMFQELLQFAAASAKRFDITDGSQVCRVMAAVGQTLGAQEEQFVHWNRALAESYREPSRPVVSDPLTTGAVVSQVLVKKAPPWQVDFCCQEQEGACLRFDGLVLWHASYIGPRSAEKSENQDATFAITSPDMSSPPYFVFALSDGVTTSMGSRFAARTIVRRFCEEVREHMKKDEPVDTSGLIEAARRTQASLEELTKTLLRGADLSVFDVVRGSELQRSTAVKVLENTLHPKVAAIPDALTATLIGGIVQFHKDTGMQQVELLRIGDGSVEHIDSKGVVTAVLDTDPETLTISEGLGPGPRSRAVFDTPDQLIVKTVMLGPRESLLVSSDGLTRGHQQSVTGKLTDLLSEPFWQKARVEEADAAMQILHRACEAADQIFERDQEQSLFNDNVSLIVIRSGG